MNRYHDIFTESHCLSKNQLFGYIQERLDKEEVYVIETHLNECDLCNAALDGLLHEPEHEVKHSLDELKIIFNERLNEEHQDIIAKSMANPANEIKPLSSNKNRWLVAASLIMLQFKGTPIFPVDESPKF